MSSGKCVRRAEISDVVRHDELNITHSCSVLHASRAAMQVLLPLLKKHVYLLLRIPNQGSQNTAVTDTHELWATDVNGQMISLVDYPAELLGHFCQLP